MLVFRAVRSARGVIPLRSDSQAGAACGGKGRAAQSVRWSHVGNLMKFREGDDGKIVGANQRG
jgi:hypothetical protein